MAEELAVAIDYSVLSVINILLFSKIFGEELKSAMLVLKELKRLGYERFHIASDDVT